MKNSLIKVILCIAIFTSFLTQAYSKPLEIGEWKQPSTEKAVHYAKYTSILNCQDKTPLYVYYDLYPEYFLQKNADRKSWWPSCVSADIKNICGADYAVNKNYNSSGYARGHLDPAANYGADINYMKETFSFANAAPQNSGFNSGLWSSIEDIERKLSVSNNGVTVITGVVQKGSIRKIKNKISVPVYFYKLVLWKDSKGKVNYQAWLAANGKPGKNTKPDDYLTDINTIEGITGLDFIDLK